jgi:hypothetical protein
VAHKAGHQCCVVCHWLVVIVVDVIVGIGSILVNWLTREGDISGDVAAGVMWYIPCH